MAPLAPGWSSTAGPAPQRRRFSRRFATFLLLLPLVVGLFGAPVSPGAPGVVRGDELSDAKARQAQIKKDIAAQAERSPSSTALQGELAAEIKNTAGELKGINADLAAVKVKITDDGGQDRRDPGRLQRPRRQAPVARRQPDRHRGPGGRQEGRPGGPQGAPRRAPAERLRHRPDVAPRDVPVGQHVHRPARRDELLHRRRRAGQGARQPDRAGPGDARRAPPGDRGHARPDQRPAPGDGGPEASPRPEPARAQRQPRPSSRSSRSGPPRRSPPEADLRRHRAQQGGRQGRPGQGRGRPEEAPGPDRRAHPQAAPGRQHPVGLQRDADLADERRRDPGLRLHRVLVGAALRRHAPTSTRASTSSPRTARRCRQRATGRSCTSAGTTPTAPTRPGS